MAIAHTREFRQTMTGHEVKLWARLRELRTLGFHFRRQSPIARYIVDFECRCARVIVEVDGTQHGCDDHRGKGEARDRTLNEFGPRVLRFANPDVDRNMDEVPETIRLALISDLNDLDRLGLPADGGEATPAPGLGKQNPTRPPSAATLPEDGEG